MNWVFENLPLIGERILQHLATAVPPVLISFLIAVPIGWLANRYRRARGTVLTLCGLLYSIPSLPLFVALPALIGTGLTDPSGVIIALTLYAIALMVRVTADGLSSVDSNVTQAANAVGFSEWSRFWRVDLPLAGPVLLAGIRVVSVSTVSLTTVGAVLGVKSLGLFFTDGIQRNIAAEIYTGIVGTVLIALVLDLLLVLVGKALMPWVPAVSPRGARRAVLRSRVAAA